MREDYSQKRFYRLLPVVRSKERNGLATMTVQLAVGDGIFADHAIANPTCLESTQSDQATDLIDLNRNVQFGSDSGN